eukprot:CAMPEP_0178464056 /NCGR_PEP_ID=MMETSP0689_2-20121128/50648_1 /TAXON_ID=160604 /ORGANISM="Amphidinium massartii, Strain CS-259" /LENGTH=134 /DNA_ID=CAMNT_0020090951 /DNA_START=296 /DNA_END=700 /DNA_ORIENTATION=+
MTPAGGSEAVLAAVAAASLCTGLRTRRPCVPVSVALCSGAMLRNPTVDELRLWAEVTKPLSILLESAGSQVRLQGGTLRECRISLLCPAPWKFPGVEGSAPLVSSCPFTAGSLGISFEKALPSRAQSSCPEKAV